MGFRYRKRINLGGGVGLNVSRSGVSPSYRTKYGSIGPKGFSVRTGIPGLSYRGGKSGDAAIIFLALFVLFGVFIVAWNLLRLLLWLAGEFFSYLQRRRAASQQAAMSTNYSAPAQSGLTSQTFKFSSGWVVFRNLAFIVIALFVAALLLLPHESNLATSPVSSSALYKPASSFAKPSLTSRQPSEVTENKYLSTKPVQTEDVIQPSSSKMETNVPPLKRSIASTNANAVPVSNRPSLALSSEVAEDTAKETTERANGPILGSPNETHSTDEIEANAPIFKDDVASEKETTRSQDPDSSGIVNATTSSDAMPPSLYGIVPPNEWGAVRRILIEGFAMGESKEFIPWGEENDAHGTIYQSGSGLDPEGCRQFRISKVEPQPLAIAYADVCPTDRIK